MSKFIKSSLVILSFLAGVSLTGCSMAAEQLEQFLETQQALEQAAQTEIVEEAPSYVNQADAYSDEEESTLSDDVSYYSDEEGAWTVDFEEESPDFVSALQEEENKDAVDKTTPSYVEYRFRSKKLLNQHYEKHGIEMGFESREDYQKAASDVINNPDALYKTEKEDGDGVYYLEETNEFVILSTDGYIRTYFNPNGGKKYFDRQ